MCIRDRVGAWLGGLIGRMTGMYEEGHPAGFLMALAGALIVLFHCCPGQEFSIPANAQHSE